MDKLRECPICGGELQIFKKANGKYIVVHESGDPDCPIHFQNAYSSAKEAAADVNRRPEPENKPKTNADRIRSMTDGELAEFIDNIAAATIKGVYCHSLGKNGTEKRGCYSDDHQEDCVGCALDWLQQPVEVVKQ